MGIGQIILTLVFYVWLFLVLWLLWFISQHVLQLLQTLSETTLKTAETAQKTAEALRYMQEEPKK